jgi:hypothetical protein
VNAVIIIYTLFRLLSCHQPSISIHHGTTRARLLLFTSTASGNDGSDEANLFGYDLLEQCHPHFASLHHPIDPIGKQSVAIGFFCPSSTYA